MAPKECFGQLANMKIVYNNSTQQHFLRVDNDKLKECDKCSLFNKCMFLKYNDMMQEMLTKLDDALKDKKSRI
jgi:hypothetical protein